MKKSHVSPFVLPSIILAVAGLADSLYLLVKHYTYSAVTCNLVEGCETVLISKYAILFGIPVSLIGVVYYAAILGSLILLFVTSPRIVSRIFFAIICFGFIFSAHFVYLQLNVIGEVCQYCMASALITISLFILGIFIFRHVSITSKEEAPDVPNIPNSNDTL